MENMIRTASKTKNTISNLNLVRNNQNQKGINQGPKTKRKVMRKRDGMEKIKIQNQSIQEEKKTNQEKKRSKAVQNSMSTMKRIDRYLKNE